MERINNLNYFRQSKLMSYKGWNILLGGNKSASDTDMVIDNGGNVLFFEFKTHINLWRECPLGQKILFENLVKIGKGKISAVICKQIESDEELYDTTKCQSFQVMYFDNGIKYSTLQCGGNFERICLEILGGNYGKQV